MNRPTRPRLVGLTAALLAVGFGLTGHYGLQWYEQPRYSEADIAASTELNLAIDLQRSGRPATPVEIDAMRREVRAEIEADIARQTRETQTGFVIGVSSLILGLGLAVAGRRPRA